MAREAVHVVFITTSAVGHLTPMVELAKRVLRLPQTTTTSHHDVAITIITIPLLGTGTAPELSASSSPNLSFLQLQPIGPPLSADLSFQAIATSVDLYVPTVRSLLQTLHSSSPVVALVSSFFCSCTIDVGVELGIPTYAFFPIGAVQLGLLLHMDTIDPLIPNGPNALEVEGKRTIVPFPGFSSSLPLSALPDALVQGKDHLYRWFLQAGLRFRRAKGILVNTFASLEPAVIEALEGGLYGGDYSTPPVYPVGPLLRLEAEGGDMHECIQWLNGQPRGSVVFLCFGSMGSFSRAQVREMALGLEWSSQRFLWVMRDEGIPEGFAERTKGRGLVWASFAPQLEILQHEAVGGFVTHCGWNSCLEGIWSGVPMATWPLYAEQHFNAYVMVKEMRVAVGVRAQRLEGNVVEADEVERVVRLLMGEGSAGVREKVKEMGEEARKALHEGVGLSYFAMRGVAKEWMSAVPWVEETKPKDIMIADMNGKILREKC